MMKAFLIAISLIFTSYVAQAADSLCAKLERQDEAVRKVRSVRITSEEQLSDLQKKQMWQLVEDNMGPVEFAELRSLQEGIDLLLEYSEGSELYYIVYNVDGEIVTHLLHYPGGNAFGLYFKGTKVVAVLIDGNVECP